MANASGGVNFSFVSDTMGVAMGNAESKLYAQIQNMGENPTQTDLLNMQVAVQKWAMNLQMISTMNQNLSEAFKGVIQKSS